MGEFGVREYSSGGVVRFIVSDCPESSVINSSIIFSGFSEEDIEIFAFGSGFPIVSSKTFNISFPSGIKNHSVYKKKSKYINVYYEAINNLPAGSVFYFLNLTIRNLLFR